MNTFFGPLVSQLRNLKKAGGVQWTNPKTGEQSPSVVSSPLLIADAPARADCLNHLYHNGKDGCITCEIKTVKM